MVGNRYTTVELFGGIGSPRCAWRNIGIPIKSIDYVEIDEKAVRSYNAMFRQELAYKPQSVVGWNLKPDVLIHGSPCQDFSIAGHQEGADEGSGTQSSLMWETINIIKQMGEWKPRWIIWENVKNVRSKHMVHNHNRYLNELENIGYENSFELLDARDFGLPQARKRVFTISSIKGIKFDFNKLEKTPMKDINNFLESDFDSKYIVTQPSMLRAMDKTQSKPFSGRVEIIKDHCKTITCKQMRSPNSGVIDIGNGRYRYLTERECWRLQGYSDVDFDAASKEHPSRKGKLNGTLYKQAGNSIPVPIMEAIFKQIIEYDDNGARQQMKLF